MSHRRQWWLTGCCCCCDGLDGDLIFLLRWRLLRNTANKNVSDWKKSIFPSLSLSFSLSPSLSLSLTGSHHFAVQCHDSQQLAGLPRSIQQTHNRVRRIIRLTCSMMMMMMMSVFYLLFFQVVEDLLCVLVAHLLCHVGQLVCGSHFRGQFPQIHPSIHPSIHPCIHTYIHCDWLCCPSFRGSVVWSQARLAMSMCPWARHDPKLLVSMCLRCMNVSYSWRSGGT